MKIINIFLVLLVLVTKHLAEATTQNLSGFYDFENCACTVLRCLERSPYELRQNLDESFIIYYKGDKVAALGRTMLIGNEQQTQVYMEWQPGMDFDTSCTGVWMPKNRLIELKCGGNQRYCTGQLKCRDRSGPCSAINSAVSLNISPINILSGITINLVFLLLI